VAAGPVAEGAQRGFANAARSASAGMTSILLHAARTTTRTHRCGAQEMTVGKLASKRGDTSQRGNWCNFRNERYPLLEQLRRQLCPRHRRLNREPFERIGEWCASIPTQGMLEFDYVSSTRPQKHAL
jgi:hypothetical protein